jgi:hypothetical protein
VWDIHYPTAAKLKDVLQVFAAGALGDVARRRAWFDILHYTFSLPRRCSFLSALHQQRHLSIREQIQLGLPILHAAFHQHSQWGLPEVCHHHSQGCFRIHRPIIRSDASDMRENLQGVPCQDVVLKLSFHLVDPIVEGGIPGEEHGVMVEI